MRTTKIAMLIVMAMTYGIYVNAQCAEGHDHSAHAEVKKEKKVVEEKILAVGEVAVIKLSHNKTDGKVTIVLLKTDKTPLALEKAPRLNLFADGKRKQVKTKAVGDSKNKFEAQGDCLKKDLNGKVSIKLGDKSYQVAINPPAHGHGPDCNH